MYICSIYICFHDAAALNIDMQIDYYQGMKSLLHDIMYS